DPIVREAWRLHDMPEALEIISLADIPAGTGLGSSGTFTVGLVRALYSMQRRHVTAEEVAREACRIEIDILQQPVGKQDQYIASYGGGTRLSFPPEGSVNAAPLRISYQRRSRPRGKPAPFFARHLRPATATPP